MDREPRFDADVFAECDEDGAQEVNGAKMKTVTRSAVAMMMSTRETAMSNFFLDRVKRGSQKERWKWRCFPNVLQFAYECNSARFSFFRGSGKEEGEVGSEPSNIMGEVAK